MVGKGETLKIALCRVKRLALGHALLIGLVILAACVPASRISSGSDQGAKVLLLRTPAALLSVRLDTGEVSNLPDSVIAAPGLSGLFASSNERGVTRVEAVDPKGTKRTVGKVPGELQVFAASARGQQIVLAPTRSQGPTPSLPEGRAQTELVIFRPGDHTSKRFTLEGNFAPEAFSTDGRRLFLIEYLPAAAPDRYRVRQLNLQTGTITGVGGRLKQPAPEEMRGTGRTQTLAPDGKTLYTLYARQVETYPHGQPATPDPHANLPIHSFVHVLNLEEGWAHCIDFPHPFGMSSTGNDALTVSPDGERLYVVDGSAGRVAAVDTRGLSVVKTTDIPAGADATFTTARATGRSLYVSVGHGVVVLDPRTLALERSFDLSDKIAGLNVSSDGGKIYVFLPDGVHVLDSATGATLTTLTISN